jgi:hypothetical protein
MMDIHPDHNIGTVPVDQLSPNNTRGIIDFYNIVVNVFIG